ncbi:MULTISPECIES: MBL fold metallo-hydrolase [unclassified Microbacterium]|uniref:MBL fold metallo-hydrolase n=1 Tax=unclassified Microbacterium TaxID=2609290 RepID=UPI00214C20AD|nr:MULTISPECIES: MBL fold metallo-hydrolase [unclassified Microbacterium]MCR2785060.1 MBL fold metallo-hydrolase [Microbacterium sp. zg.B96]WIM16595.1 MBL fold metallo-hydrolase [Microbacterium sp. zg-B96]
MTAPTTPWQECAPGAHRLSRAQVNCYLLAGADGLTLVDTGLPGMWRDLVSLLRTLDATPSDIDAVLLTHGHFDHVGMSRQLAEDHAVRHFVHEGDRRLARHPYRYRHAAPRWVYPLRHPRAIPILARMTAAGALTVKGVEAEGTVVPGRALDVPGTPVPVFTPGHTDGHCAFLLPASGVLLSGDALVTLDPYTGASGPRIVANAATADPDSALTALTALAGTGANTVLPGHGEPWTEGIRAAVTLAAREGTA